MRSRFAFLLTALALLTTAAAAGAGEWTSLFDGKSFDGWKASENSDSWSIEDGAFKCDGPRFRVPLQGEDHSRQQLRHLLSH